MHDEGFAVALVLGLAALLLPVVWMAWWYVADVVEVADVYDRRRPRVV